MDLQARAWFNPDLKSRVYNVPAVAGMIAGQIDPRVILQGFAIALLVGLIGAAYPAYRAARLMPTAPSAIATAMMIRPARIILINSTCSEGVRSVERVRPKADIP